MATLHHHDNPIIGGFGGGVKTFFILRPNFEPKEIKDIKKATAPTKVGAFVWKDEFAQKGVLAFVTPTYLELVFPYVVTAQPIGGQVNIYARTTDGNLCPDGTTGTFNILMLKP